MSRKSRKKKKGIYSHEKSRGIISLILVAAVMALIGVKSNRRLNSYGMGAARNIKRGLDLEGGVSITYQGTGDTH